MPNQEKIDALNGVISKLRDNADQELIAWNAFVRELKVPHDLVPGLASGRVELLAVLKSRVLSEVECAALYNLVATLAQTNASLRKHAEATADLVNRWSGSFAALHTLGDQIEHFANFRALDESEKEAA